MPDRAWKKRKQRTKPKCASDWETAIAFCFLLPK